MSPFHTDLVLPGIEKKPDGSIVFELTDLEANAADLALKQFKGFEVHKSVAQKLRNGTIAVALSLHAKTLVSTYLPEITESFGAPSAPVRAVLKNAIAAEWKAYSLCPLPVFTYHAANFFRMLNRIDEAEYLFELFRKQQAAFQPDQIDESLIGYEGTDIKRASSRDQ